MDVFVFAVVDRLPFVLVIDGPVFFPGGRHAFLPIWDMDRYPDNGFSGSFVGSGSMEKILFYGQSNAKFCM